MVESPSSETGGASSGGLAATTTPCELVMGTAIARSTTAVARNFIHRLAIDGNSSDTVAVVPTELLLEPSPQKGIGSDEPEVKPD
jgi:hypothetical protein